MPPSVRVEFGDRGEERVQVDVRHARVEQAAEPLDEADDLDLRWLARVTAP